MSWSIPTAVFRDSDVMKHSYSGVSWLWCYEAFLQRCFLTMVLWSIPTAVFHDSDVMKHSYSSVSWLGCHEAFLQRCFVTRMSWTTAVFHDPVLWSISIALFHDSVVMKHSYSNISIFNNNYSILKSCRTSGCTCSDWKRVWQRTLLGQDLHLLIWS